MKKFKSILALTASVLALSAFAAPVSAFASDTYTAAGDASQTAKHTEDASYIVTIPAQVLINTPAGNNYTGTAEISATGKIAATSTLTVTAETKQNPVLTCGVGNSAVSAPYSAEIESSGANIFESGVAVLSGSGALENVSATINYSAPKAGFIVAGDYTDTITFTIAVTGTAPVQPGEP